MHFLFHTQTFLGVLYHNENEADGMTSILKELHIKYVPYHGKGAKRQYANQAIVGDQLTVERGVNTHNTLSNGFTPKQILEGLHFEFADWHAGLARSKFNASGQSRTSLLLRARFNYKVLKINAIACIYVTFHLRNVQIYNKLKYRTI